LPKPFAIKRFRTLSQNTRGGGLLLRSVLPGFSHASFRDAQQRPQTLSPHGLTSRFSGYPGGGPEARKRPQAPFSPPSTFNFRPSTSSIHHSLPTHDSPSFGQPTPRPRKRRDTQLGVYSLPAGGQNNFPPPAFQKKL
jgi:hypothetical protein